MFLELFQGARLNTLAIHLSILRPGGGGGAGYPQGFDCEVCPQRVDFDHTRYPQGGESDMTTILDNEEGLVNQPVM